MIRKVYCIWGVDNNGNLKFREYARNLKTANKIKRLNERRGYEVIIEDYTKDYKDGAPILKEWIKS